MKTFRLLHNIGTEHHSNYNSREEVLACNDILTFDGIYKNVHENMDVLKGKDVILFVVNDLVGKDNTFDLHAVPKLEQYCTYKEILEILEYVRNNGGTAELGYHSRSHADLTKLNKEQIMKEVEKLGYFKSFAYPHGRYNDLVIECLKEAGYERAFSVFNTDGTQWTIPRPYLNH